MSLSESTISQLQSLKDAGDIASAESYYNILADNGHDYGNFTLQTVIVFTVSTIIKANCNWRHHK